MLHLRITGSGAPSVLLLHGAPSLADEFKPLVEAFGRRHRFFWPDMPGYGLSEPIEGKTTLPRVQTLLEDALLALNVKELAVIGFDLGAYRALTLAMSPRFRVTDVMLIGGFASWEAADRELQRGFAEAVRGQETFASEDFRRAFADRQLASTTVLEKPERVAELNRALDATKPPLLADELESMLEARDLLPHLGTLKTRLTARVGSQDAVTPVRYSEEIVKRVRGAKLQVVPAAGHALLIDDPHRTLEAIDEVLRAQLAPRRDE